MCTNQIVEMTLSILARELKRCIALFCAKALYSIDKMLLLGIIENTDKIGFKYCLNTFQMLWNHIWSTVVIPLKYGQYMSWLARNIDQFKWNHIFYFSSFITFNYKSNKKKNSKKRERRNTLKFYLFNLKKKEEEKEDWMNWID